MRVAVAILFSGHDSSHKRLAQRGATCDFLYLHFSPMIFEIAVRHSDIQISNIQFMLLEKLACTQQVSVGQARSCDCRTWEKHCATYDSKSCFPRLKPKKFRFISKRCRGAELALFLYLSGYFYSSGVNAAVVEGVGACTACTQADDYIFHIEKLSRFHSKLCGN